MKAECKSEISENMFRYVLARHFKQSCFCIVDIYLMLDMHTGSFPSIASIHSRLLASQSACKVMTPCLPRKGFLNGGTLQQQPYLSLASVYTDTHSIPYSPLRHLDVEAEAFVDWFCLPSDTRAQLEHLRCTVHHAVLLTETCVVVYLSWTLTKKWYWSNKCALTATLHDTDVCRDCFSFLRVHSSACVKMWNSLNYYF